MIYQINQTVTKFETTTTMMMSSSSTGNDSSLCFGSEFWPLNSYGGSATIFALFLILISHLLFIFVRFFNLRHRYSSSPIPSQSTPSTSTSGIPEIVSQADFKFLIRNLEFDDKLCQNEKWENVIDKKSLLLSYNAKCCKPQDGGPLKYLSVTVFENCSTELLRDFYMDNEYRKQWDKTVTEHHQLQVDQSNGVEIGRTIKKFTLLTPREYVLAWRLWEGKDKTFYCFVKECEHPSAPKQRRFVRVGYYRSGWRIRKVPGRNACEIKMFHQEDAGLNMEMAKLAFAKGIWSYVCKMNNAFRKYNPGSIKTNPSVTAVTLIQKVLSELDVRRNNMDLPTSPASNNVLRVHASEGKEKRFLRKPSKLVIANGLLLIGSVICLSRGRSSLGAKVAMAYVLTKLNNRGASSSQSGQS